MTDNSRETIVITGATGFLGSHLMAALVERGHRVVVLGRPSGKTTLAERIASILKWFGLEERGKQVEPLEADLLAPRCGLGRTRYFGLCLKAKQILHCASDTRFAETNRGASIDANVRSLGPVLQLAHDSAVSFFHYVSTAYVTAGESRCPEEQVPSAQHANVYEETKAWAEREVAAESDRLGIPFTILRPSIVYGDSRTGKATRFTALYHHVRSLYLIRDIYLKEIREHGGERARRHDIRLDDNGILQLPLRIFLPRRGSINLIPIDYFVDAVLSVMDHGENGIIYHLTSDEPESMETLASYCERFLNLKGIDIRYDLPAGGIEHNPPEALFDKFVEPYRPYLSDPRTFDRCNTDRATAGLTPPRFTYDIFRRCMEYAISVNWGR